MTDDIELNTDVADYVGLGEFLREARLRRNLTLAEIERDTRINREYLEALENEQYEILPAPVYARGFLRSYALHLGLDHEEVLSLLPTDLPRPSGLEPLPGLRRRPGTAFPKLNFRVAAGIGGAALLILFLIVVRGSVTGDARPEVEDSNFVVPTSSLTVPTLTTSVSTVPPFESGETPNFIGIDGSSAQELLTELGFQFVVIEMSLADTPKGQVFAQAPDPGTSIESGGSVTLVISSGAAD